MATEGTNPSAPPSSVAQLSKTIEYTMVINTSAHRVSVRADALPEIEGLKALFGAITLRKVTCEVRQNTLIGSEAGQLVANGHTFVALVPTGKNNEMLIGRNSATVMSVPRKQTFPLSSHQQNNQLFHFDLTGFELDLAQDPRRNQGVVLWTGNSGISAFDADDGDQDSSDPPICTITWMLDVACVGPSTLW